jgi:hypothetical protein
MRIAVREEDDRQDAPHLRAAAQLEKLAVPTRARALLAKRRKENQGCGQAVAG